MSATDPYAAKGPRRTAQEVELDLPYFLRRLEALGATPDEIEQVEQTWDTFDGDWTPERRAQMVRANDSELVGLIDTARTEWFEGTTTEDEEAEARQASLAAEARSVVGGTVGEALAWVGADPARAAAVLAAETEGGGGRSTLVKPLSELVSERVK
jgi:hypothetical protein